MSKAADILVIDDEQVVEDAVIKICTLDDYTVDVAANVKSAIEKISKNYYPIIVCDIMMPDGDGFQILDELHNRNIDSSVIMTTGYSTVENAVNSLYKGAIDFIPKPFTVDELLSSVYRANKYQQIKSKQKSFPVQNQNLELLYVNCPVKYLRLGYASWMFEERDGSVLIGVCDLFLKTIEVIKEIELQLPEEEIMQGISCISVKSVDERTHKILSPVSGRIVEVNGNIKLNSSLIEKDPYFEGWVYRVIPTDIDYEKKYLIMCSSELL
ncbi:MAG: response regulator [Ignavibacteriaceae bacterium]|nr:response regulator [Ignavibacteriaceae bacterium]